MSAIEQVRWTEREGRMSYRYILEAIGVPSGARVHWVRLPHMHSAEFVRLVRLARPLRGGKRVWTKKSSLQLSVVAWTWFVPRTQRKQPHSSPQLSISVHHPRIRCASRRHRPHFNHDFYVQTQTTHASTPRGWHVH